MRTSEKKPNAAATTKAEVVSSTAGITGDCAWANLFNICNGRRAEPHLRSDRREKVILRPSRCEGCGSPVLSIVAVHTLHHEPQFKWYFPDSGESSDEGEQ